MIIMNQQTIKKRLVAGCMTGTSIDALDVALIEITGSGLAMKATIRRYLSHPIGDALSFSLRRFAQQRAISAGEIIQISHDLSSLHLTALKELIRDDVVDLIAIHGQTVFHAPPLSWQLLNPAIVAYGCEVPVIYNLRSADLAVGGQGAPITPIADYVLYRSSEENRCIVNLGGFCNVTVLPQSNKINQIRGGDVCVCNQLLDQIARKLLSKPFDNNGEVALTGSAIKAPLNQLKGILSNQNIDRRSLGTGDESFDWLERYRNAYPANNLLRTACAAIAHTVWESVKQSKPHRLIIAGGGAFNMALMDELRAYSTDTSLELSDQYGIPINYREATAMSVLGALCQDRVPITLTQITGVSSAPISGCWVLP